MARLIKPRNNLVNLNGTQLLDTNHLLNATDFPSITGDLYGWNTFAQGTLANADWTGSEDLVDASSGSIAYNVDHLGTSSNAVDVTPASNNCVYINSGTFDTDDEDFTIGMWYQADASTPSADEWLCSKWNSTDAQKSFYLVRTTGNVLAFYYYYDNAGRAVNLSISDVTDLGDGNYHHIAASYNYVSANEAWLALYIDGNCRGYKKIDTAGKGSRNNNTTAKLTWGGRDGSGTPANEIDGRMADMFYLLDQVLSANEIRKIYAAGCQRFCTEAGSNSGNSKVAILDGRKNNGFYQLLQATTFPIPNAYGDVTGQIFYIPEDGFYSITSQGSIRTRATASIGQSSYVRLYDGSSVLPGTDMRLTLAASDNAEWVETPYYLNYIGYFEENTVVKLQADASSAGDACEIAVVDGLTAPYIRWEKLD